MRRGPVRAAFAAAAFAVAGGLLVSSAACGPVSYIASSTLDASKEVSHAKDLKASRFAPYEITAAQEYLHKSRELAGYARFQPSVEFAHKASQLAKEATSLSEEKSRLPGADHEEAPVDETPATPPPTPHAPPPTHDAAPTGPGRQ